MKTTSEFSDTALLRNKRNIYQALGTKEGAALALVIGVLNFTLGVSGFILRIFLRKRLGSRTFGLITCACAYLTVQWLEAIHQKPKAANLAASLENILEPIMIFLDKLIGSNNYNLNRGLSPLSRDITLHWFALAVLFLGIAHYISAFIRDFRKEKLYSYSRGESILFGWLVGKHLFNIKITDTAVWVLIEPLFVYLVSLFIGTTPEGEGLAFVLQISAFCLFCQEYTVFQKKRAMVLDFIDSEIEAAEIFEEVNQYKSLNSNLDKPQITPQSEVVV